MARTKGSGWGGGTLLYQICPLCGKKKCIYDHIPGTGIPSFKCTYCKKRFNSETLIHQTYP
jgi:hypothetical protein